MSDEVQTHHEMSATLVRIEEHVRRRLTGLVRDFRLVFCNQGLVLRGRVHTFYAKQLTQHAVMEVSSLPILANDMEVG